MLYVHIPKAFSVEKKVTWTHTMRNEMIDSLDGALSLDIGRRGGFTNWVGIPDFDCQLYGTDFSFRLQMKIIIVHYQASNLTTWWMKFDFVSIGLKGMKTHCQYFFHSHRFFPDQHAHALLTIRLSFLIAVFTFFVSRVLTDHAKFVNKVTCFFLC